MSAEVSSVRPNPYIFDIENRRKRRPRLAHEIGAGAKCKKCGDKCPGFELHFWRKLCMNCRCGIYDHEVEEDDEDIGKIVIGKLFDRPPRTKKEEMEYCHGNNLEMINEETGKAENVKFDWVPPNVEKSLASRYMALIPVEKRPIAGTEAAKERKRQLEQQLPLYDMDAAQRCDNLPPEELQSFHAYLERIKTQVAGQGMVQEIIGAPVSMAQPLQSQRKPGSSAPLMTGDIDANGNIGYQPDSSVGQMMPPGSHMPQDNIPGSQGQYRSPTGNQNDDQGNVNVNDPRYQFLGGMIEEPYLNVTSRPEDLVHSEAYGGKLGTSRPLTSLARNQPLDNVTAGMANLQVQPQGQGTEKGYIPGQEHIPGQPGYVPGQPGYKPGQPGSLPGQPGYTSGPAGSQPGQPSRLNLDMLKASQVNQDIFKASQVNPDMLKASQVNPDMLKASRVNLDILMASRDNLDILLASRVNQDILMVNQVNQDTWQASRINLDMFRGNQAPYGARVDTLTGGSSIAPGQDVNVLFPGESQIIGSQAGNTAPSGQKSKFSCQYCNLPMNVGDVAIFCERAGQDKCWHPACFCCFTCKELLADLIYFYKDGNVFCGRHFTDAAEIPRCKACDELIFGNSWTRADGFDWHIHHYSCYMCDLELAGQRYVPDKEGYPYCLPCYMACLAKMCEACEEKISPEMNRCGHRGYFYHASPQCFKCYSCKIPLMGKRFKMSKNWVFCSNECIEAAAEALAVNPNPKIKPE
ncbi:putative testin isoform X1 [Penaeus vannamei]|uniref:Putative testin isoform X1 n=1 Tax=Penaeus vannamei TaxID=6689 RepID=A0A423TE63_PENVA|nr:putative testin isoform X1 [Penaeus vannamei]